MPRGLAPKLILSVTAIVVIVEGVFAFFNVRIQERELLEKAVLRTDQLSTTIKSATWHAMLADHRESAYQMMRTIGKDDGIRKVRIFNKSGENVEIAFSTGDDVGRSVDKTAEACTLCHALGEPLVRPNTSSRVRYFEEDGQRLLGMVTPIYNEPACSSTKCHDGPNPHSPSIHVLGVLDISVPLDQEQAAAAGIRQRAALVAVTSILLIGACVFILTRYFIARPVKKLIAATEEMGAMKLDHPVVADSNDEIGDLAKSFDTMRLHLLDAREEIEDFTRNLEEKVEERTQQLDATQKKLMQTDRLASLGRLAASVAHEINNPLSAVLNFAKLMERIMGDEGVPRNRVDDFRRYLGQIVAETTRTGKIVSDLLAFSRRSPPEAADTDLNELVRNTMSVLAHKLDLQDVRHEMHLAEEVPTIHCNASRIQQVLANLVLNAAEATRRDGKVVVRTRPGPDGETAILQISDNGLGIPKDQLGRIFDPFFTTKEEGKGIGLGLAVVYGIVEAHGGAIDVESEVGRGTTFTVRLPVIADVREQRAAPEEE